MYDFIAFLIITYDGQLLDCMDGHSKLLLFAADCCITNSSFNYNCTSAHHPKIVECALQLYQKSPKSPKPEITNEERALEGEKRKKEEQTTNQQNQENIGYTKRKIKDELDYIERGGHRAPPPFKKIPDNLTRPYCQKIKAMTNYCKVYVCL